MSITELINDLVTIETGYDSGIFHKDTSIMTPEEMELFNNHYPDIEIGY